MDITIHIWTTKDERSITFTDAEHKARYCEDLPKVIKPEDFKRATVNYGEGHAHEFKTLEELISQLGKFGG